MKKILAFGASISKNSINKTFAIYAANQLQNVEKTIFRRLLSLGKDI